MAQRDFWSGDKKQEVGVDMAHKEARRIPGDAGEFLAAAELRLLGYQVFFAPEQLGYDLVCEKNGHFRKVQVKSASQIWHADKRNRYNFVAGPAKTSLGKKYKGMILACVAIPERKVMFFAEDQLPSAHSFRIAQTEFLDGERLAEHNRDAINGYLSRTIKRIRLFDVLEDV